MAITRSPEKLADVAAKGVEVRAGDFAQADQLPAAFAGVERLYVISVDDATPGLRPRLHGLPQHVAEMIVGLDRGFRLGAVDVVSRAVEMLTGTPPMTLPEFLALHKDQFLAKPSA